MSLGITEDVIARQPPEAQAIIRLLLAKIAELEARIEELQRQGKGKTPQNSSLPPSTQHPHARPQPPKRKSRKKRGGQPGHEKHERPLIPTDQCDDVQTLKPTECRRCRGKLSGSDPEPLRHQVWELPEIKKYVWVGGRYYFLVCFLDEYSRYIVHHELLWGMDGPAVGLAAQAALETLPVDAEKRLVETPQMRSDNGSCFISREFGGVLDEHGLIHRRIKPHCPEENGVMERAQRTIGEALEGEELTDYLQAVQVLGRLVRWYNEQRLHSALGFLRPVDYYRGEPERMYAVRRQKLAEARHRRRERNLQLRQPTLPFTSEETVA